MNRKYLFLLLVFISCSIHAMAQTDFYYYRGKKIPLTRKGGRGTVIIF